MTTLMEFARTEGKARGGITCWLCSIPDRAEVEEAAKNGVPQSIIVRWLKEKKGYAEQATPSRVGRHLREHVSR